MSARTSILLTADNEHWYRSCRGKMDEGSETDNPIILEFSPEHKSVSDINGTRIIIEENTPLYIALKEIILK